MAPEQRQPCAFRVTEKKYQLHKEQQIRYSKGRKHGGKLVTMPTDFSDVLDLWSPATQHGSNVDVTYSHCLKSPVFSLHDHPGCFYIPGLLDSRQQLDLFSQALQSFPEPPNTSNLTASYGPLTSLWDAAQKGLFLNHLISAQAADAVHTATDSTASARKGHLVQTEQLSHLSELPATSLQDNTQTPDLLHIHQLSAPSDLSEEHTGRGFTHNQGAGETQAKAVSPNVWTNSQTDNEPSAKSLLQRLRWVALGPQFNWTTRQYETHPGVKPLPQDLVSLAQLAVKACAEADHEQTSPSSQVAAASNDSLQRGPDDTTASGNAPQSDASHPASCSIVHSCSTVTAEYNPDTALVNYYREGDTLGGHKDDAEEHDTMPIVSLSLGCEGVFLIGGHSKDETPTALMLHSGDVLVLSGHARQCYHGVPRILPGQCCCSQAQVNDQAVPAVETWMQDMRVNISIRQT